MGGSGSADGISFTSVLLELIAITFSGAYSFSNNFPFSSYGESVFLAIQTGIIALLVLSYTRGKFQALVFGALYAGAVYVLTNPVITPAQFLWYGQASNIPMIILGKMIQIITNFRNGHTGQLSAITSFLLSLGAIARIFTSFRRLETILSSSPMSAAVLSTPLLLSRFSFTGTRPLT